MVLALLKVELSWSDLLVEVRKTGMGVGPLSEDILDVPGCWSKIKIGKFEYICYEGEMIPK